VERLDLLLFGADCTGVSGFRLPEIKLLNASRVFAMSLLGILIFYDKIGKGLLKVFFFIKNLYLVDELVKNFSLIYIYFSHYKIVCIILNN
jgi:hypothetical protein